MLWNEVSIIFRFIIPDEGCHTLYRRAQDFCRKFLPFYINSQLGVTASHQLEFPNQEPNFSWIKSGFPIMLMAIGFGHCHNHYGFLGKYAAPENNSIQIQPGKFLVPIVLTEKPEKSAGLNLLLKHHSMTLATPAARRLLTLTEELLGCYRPDKQFPNYSVAMISALIQYLNRMNFNETNPRKDALPPYERDKDGAPVIPKEF